MKGKECELLGWVEELKKGSRFIGKQVDRRKVKEKEGRVERKERREEVGGKEKSTNVVYDGDRIQGETERMKKNL